MLENNPSSTFSSINIPLNRAFIMLLFGYFGFEWENINKESFEELICELGDNIGSNFRQFLMQQAQFPMRVVNFMKVFIYFQYFILIINKRKLKLDCGIIKENPSPNKQNYTSLKKFNLTYQTVYLFNLL